MSNSSVVSIFKTALQIWAYSCTYHIYLIKHSHFITFHFVITISQYLEFKVKIQNDPAGNRQIITTTESSVPWSDLNFPNVFSKTLLDSSTLRRFLSAICSFVLHIPNTADELVNFTFARKHSKWFFFFLSSLAQITFRHFEIVICKARFSLRLSHDT